MENISSRVPAGESYLVLFDYKAVEEDEIDLEAGQVGGRRIMRTFGVNNNILRWLKLHRNMSAMKITGKARPVAKEDFSLISSSRSRSIKLCMSSRLRLRTN